MDKSEWKIAEEKQNESKSIIKQTSRIKFNLSKPHLECFISPLRPSKHPDISQSSKLKSDSSCPPLSNTIHICHEIHPPTPKPAFDLTLSLFDNKLLLMQYGQDEVYIDSSKFKNSPLESPKHESSEGEDELVASCVRVITQQTDNTSNPLSGRARIPLGMPTYEPYSYLMYGELQRVRNRRSISTEESCNYQIEVLNIGRDGRTTLMLRNIPNKYTRDMILDEIDCLNFKKKYDFFYLPIDYRNQCNVGYAFINFIHTKFISDFHKHFHKKKWQKFNSEKICQVCYARIQGTAQLVSHFKGSNVIQQKDKKLRPLIDASFQTLAEMVERQKTSIQNADE